MYIWLNRHSVITILTTALLLYLMHTHGNYIIWNVIYKLDPIEEEASSSVVKDIRGKEPYMTIKITCYYRDNKPYGDQWHAVIANNELHKELFGKCFSNRTVDGRHETHVITFSRYESIERCMCMDVYGWCDVKCPNFQNIRCCLDKGRQSVLCRK